MVVCTCLASALGGCRANAGRPRIWAADDMVHLTERTPASAAGPAWEAETATIRLFSAANESVSFQLVIDAVEDLKRIRLSAGPLVAGNRQIGLESFRLFRMLPVAIERYPAWYLRLAESAVQPARFYDALVPTPPSRRGKSLDLPAGGRLAVWVDVHVPRQALPGDYLGPVTVRYGFRRSVSVWVRLKVYDFVLPDARPIACVGGFGHETIFRQLGRAGPPGRGKPYVPARLDTSNEEVRAALVVIRKLMRLAREHRLDLFDKGIHPLLKRDAFGEVVLGWDEYDNIVKPYLDGTAFDDRIGVAAWPAPLWLGAPQRKTPASGASAGWPRPEYYGGVDGEAYRDTAAAVLSQTVKHFEALGMSEKLFLWPRAGRAGRSGYRRHAALARLARSVEPELPILTTLSPAPPPQANLSVPEDFPRLADMFAPPADMFAPGDVAGVAHGRGPLAGLWLRPGRPPYLGGCGVLALPADVRALPWVAMKYNCLGLFLPEVLNWNADPYPGAAGGEDRLFYPGEDGAVLASVRL